LLKHYCNVEFDVVQLPLGDLATEHALVERKSFRDYVASLVDGRLFDQAHRMFESGKECFIVVHGDHEASRNVTDAQIFGSMAALVVENNIPVLWLPPLSYALYCAVKILEKVEQGKRFKPRRPRKPKRTRSPWCVRKLAQFFEVPERVAAGLLMKYGSVANISKASKEDLQKIDGVGFIRAERIKTLLSKDWRK